ncbi:porin PorA family protein [Longispora albida]|uniref:porin PorA family protein n=1 Tax=Longispora albida TaxID=203523 RepID=UPI0003654072|nr:porin PorA family protein [Longispora albida]
MGKSSKVVIPLAALGALLVASAAVLNWVVVPGSKQLPEDTNTTRQFSGTAKYLLNPQAVAAGDLANALLSNVPVTAERTVKVQATDGDAAKVSDLRSLKGPTGQELGKSDTTYAVDRKTLEKAGKKPAGWTVTDHQGLTVSWSIGAEKKEYTAWLNETKTTTAVKFVREETKGGVSSYVYEATSAAAPIKDEQVLAALPKALPAKALAALAPKLPIPDSAKGQLSQALPALGDPVPLSYTYEVKSSYWVEPATGLVVDTERTEIRKVVIGGSLAVPIYEVSTKFTDASVTAAAKDATDKRDSLNTYGKTLPLGLLVAGLVALAAAAAAGIMGRRRTE